MMSLSFPLSLCIGLLLLKSNIFFSSFFSMEVVSIFLVMVFPLVCSLLIFPSFNSVSFKESILHFLMFGVVIFFLTFCFFSLDSFLFLIFLENCVMLMFLCVVFFSKDYDKISSSLFMFFINMFPSIAFMNFCQSWSAPLGVMHYWVKDSISILCFLSFLGLLISKLPFFSLHFWLTKAHVSASGCGSMILASLMLKIGSMGLIKFYFLFRHVYSLLSSIVFSAVCWFTMVLLLVMVRFFDLKYLVACSSIVHMGPLFCLVLQGSSYNLLGSCYMQVGHGLVSYFIFFVITMIYELSYHRSTDQNKSLSSSTPIFMFFIFFFFLLNMGFPPFCSFLSELLFALSFMTMDILVFLIFVLSLIPSGIFFFFMISKMIFGKKFNSLTGTVSGFFFLISYFFFFIFLLLPLVFF